MDQHGGVDQVPAGANRGRISGILASAWIIGNAFGLHDCSDWPPAHGQHLRRDDGPRIGLAQGSMQRPALFVEVTTPRRVRPRMRLPGARARCERGIQIFLGLRDVEDRAGPERLGSAAN